MKIIEPEGIEEMSLLAHLAFDIKRPRPRVEAPGCLGRLSSVYTGSVSGHYP